MGKVKEEKRMRYNLQFFGGRGASGIKAKKKSRFSTKSVVKRQEKQSSVQTTANYIKEQVNIDISKYREPSFDGKGYITVDWKAMSRNEQNAIMLLANKYKRLIITDYGAWGKWLKIRKK